MKVSHLFLVAGLFLFSISMKAQEKATAGPWILSYDKGVNITHNGKTILSQVSAEFAADSVTKISSANYTTHKTALTHSKDKFGSATVWTVTYTSPKHPKLVQTFKLYDDYIVVSAQISGGGKLSANYIAPVVSNNTCDFFRSSENRTLFVPFDNDAWIRFRSDHADKNDVRSYEVTAVYNANSRNGIVLGAIDHNIWKNAVDITSKGSNIKLFSGVADNLTRDHKVHGTVSGKSISSARFIIGVFNDWRNGMDIYADANTIVTPRRSWGKAVPFGWNSWGTLQFNVNHQNSTEVSKFFHDNLQSHSFKNADGLTYIGIDSGWNSFSDSDLKDFANQCKARNQVPCIYWTPFADWGKDGERQVPGTKFKYKDVWLYANGKPQELDGAYAVDPTHPAIRKTMEDIAKKFRELGFEYVKMDFMTHGRLEADSWYNKKITTGTEAYNYGMQLLDTIFHGMYLNLSISPIFPAQYAQSRRIACDAWNKIKDTEYTMNALSYGWWVGRVYDFNDADHVVLRDASDGENRARITSSAITGLLIIGDDFSSGIKNEVVRDRAMSYLTNSAINHMANGISFQPLEGDNDNTESCFIRHEANGDVYLVCFNYDDNNKVYNIDPKRLGIDSYNDYEVTELWTGHHSDLSQGIAVPTKDVRIFLLKKK